MDSKFIFSFILFFSCGVFVGSLQAAAGNNSSMDCLQKLLPCKPFLHSPPSPPSDTCCLPLRQLIVNETQCLCAVVTNPGILQKFNITADDATNLAKACGGNADLSACQNATSPAGSLKTPPPPAEGANSGSGSSSSSSPPKSSATRRAEIGISHRGLSALFPIFVCLSLWAAEEQGLYSFI